MGWILKKTRKVLWVTDYRDLWTEDAAQIKLGPYQKSLFRGVENAILKSTDAIITVSPSWQRYLASRCEAIGSAASVSLIRNGHDLDIRYLHKQAVPQVRKRLICHFNGTPQMKNYPRVLLEALYRLKEEGHRESELPVFTFSGFDQQLRFEVKKLGLQNCVQDIGMMRYQESVERCIESDVLIVVVTRGQSINAGIVPAKLYEALALGKHILAIVPRESDVRTLLANYGNATVCNAEDLCEIAARILRLQADFLRAGSTAPLASLPVRSEAFFEYRRERQSEQLISLIATLDCEARLTGSANN